MYPGQQLQQRNLPSAGAVTRRFIPFVLLALFALQSIWFIATQSLTYDEPAHIIAGTEAWQQGRFERWNDHPPLGRLWLTLPIAGTSVNFDQEVSGSQLRMTAMRPGPEWLSWRTRPMNTLLGLALGAALWFTARRMFSEGAANVALGLFAFTPSLLAHFSLATTDGIGALFIFLVAVQIVRWRKRADIVQTLLMGLALGGLLLSKFYAPPLVLLALALMLVLDRDGRQLFSTKWNWKPMLTALAVAILTLWAGYFFHISHLKVGEGKVVATYPNRPVRVWVVQTNLTVNTYVPAGEFVEGLREVIRNNHHGRPAWLLGKIYPNGGAKLYYPLAILLKWPMTVLLLCVLSLALGLRRTSRAPGDLLLLLLFPLVFVAFALNSGYNIGERHVLPLYAFALLVASGIWEHARKSQAAKVFVILALCLNAADAMRSAPDYLSYFNVFEKPENAWRLLTDSNLDWGQGLIALRMYQQQHPNEVLHLAYFGSVDPELYGIHAVRLVEGQRTEGKVVIGATLLSGQVLADTDAYHWLWPYPPKGLIDHSLWVYDIK